MISAHDHAHWHKRRTSEPLEATRDLMQIWLKSYAIEGKRSPEAPGLQCLAPDRKRYPNARPMTFNLDNLAVLMGKELPELWTYLSRSFQHGFDLELDEQRASISFANPAMDPDAAAALTAGLQEELAAGFIARRHGSEPVWVGNPIRGELKKFGRPVVPHKYRRVTNNSKGTATFPSVNAAISAENATLQYTTTDEAAQETVRVNRAGGNPGTAHFLKYDCKSAYRQLALKPDQVGLVGFTGLDGTQFCDLRLPFGSRSACRIYSSLSGTVAWIAQQILGVDYVRAYLDDFLAIVTGRRRAKTAGDIMRLLFQLLGLPLEASKTEEAVQQVVFLGVLFDSVAETMAMPPERQTLLQEILEEWSTRTQASRTELESLAGTLIYAAKTVPQGRLFTRRVFAQIKVIDRRHWRRPVALGAEFHKDVSWWINFLSIWNGTRKMKSTEDDAATPFALCVGDASNVAGGGFKDDRYFQIVWQGKLATLQAKHVNTKELFVVVVGALTWAPELRGKRVLFRCDNMVSVHAVRQAKSQSPDVLHLLRVLNFTAALYDFEYEIEHISGVKNTMADDISRKTLEQLAREMPKMRLVKPTLPPHFTSPNWEKKAVDALKAKFGI